MLRGTAIPSHVDHELWLLKEDVQVSMNKTPTKSLMRRKAAQISDPLSPESNPPTSRDSQSQTRLAAGSEPLGAEQQTIIPTMEATTDKPGVKSLVDFWSHAAVISPNNFVNKSLSNWSFNIAVGCSHGCIFCYVPSVSTIKQSAKLAVYGVDDPDEQWGQYVLLRTWDEAKFMASLRAAQNTPAESLKADGNRAIIYCSTTDPYQAIFHSDQKKRAELHERARFLVTRSLELIRDHSTLRVRILTRSPLAKLDFGLFKSFGNRLLFGMSLPTLRDDLARIYEPRAPSPTQRLQTLKAAKEAGIPIYVAMAPTYPECDRDDLAATLKAVREIEPVTIFHEPINIRAENVLRIKAQAEKLGVVLNTSAFASSAAWQNYARQALKDVQLLAKELGLSKQLHLWPDKALGSKTSLGMMPDPEKYQKWLDGHWDRISAWPR